MHVYFSPFFSEEHSFRVPRDFSRLSFYICELGLHKESQFGKVSILHDELKTSGTWEEQWYPLQHIDADSEVQVRYSVRDPPGLYVSMHPQGKLHLALSVEGIEVTEGDDKQTQQMLTIRSGAFEFLFHTIMCHIFRVLEADGLSGWGTGNGCPDPYCHVSVLPNTPALKSELRRGTCRKKTTNPNFQDIFSFAVREFCFFLPYL